MSEIEKFKQGAEILQQVDVTDIISSLAVGIATAQEQLDNNSIKQALAIADPSNGMGGKSLLSLGFMPAFYHFQYADVSAEIALKMRTKNDTEVDVGIDFNYDKQGGYSSEKMDLLKEDESDKSKSEFKSSRSFITHSNNYEDLTIESEKVKMDETKGCVTRVEDFADQIRSNTKIDRVHTEVINEKHIASESGSANTSVSIQNIGGYIVITLPENHADDEGVLKVTNYDPTMATAVEFDGNSGNEFDISQSDMKNFYEVFGASESAIDVPAGGSVIGFNATENVYYESDKSTANAANNVSGNGEKIEVYFEHDKWDASLTMLKTNLTDTQNSVSKNNAIIDPILKKLAKVLINDPDAKINIIGHTDGSGETAYNERLSLKRSKSLRDYLVAQGVPIGQMTPVGKGEEIAQTDQTKNLTFRKVTIEFTSGADYFFYSGGVFDATSATADTENSFIYLNEGVISPPSPLFVYFGIGTEMYLDNTSQGFLDLDAISKHSSVTDSFTSEVIGNSLYLLHNEANLKYLTYSKESETQSYAIGSREAEDFSDTESKYLIREISNTKTKIKKDQEKKNNPSTVAVGASVDVRVARQFEMSVSGNSKVSARLVSLPAPPEFLDEIKSYYNE